MSTHSHRDERVVGTLIVGRYHTNVDVDVGRYDFVQDVCDRTERLFDMAHHASHLIMSVEFSHLPPRYSYVFNGVLSLEAQPLEQNP